MGLSTAGRWMQRGRLLFAMLLVWFATHQLAAPLVWGHPIEAPLTLFVGHPLLPQLVVLAAFLVASLLAASVLAGDACRTFVAVGAGVALWAWSGGTMDDWLVLRHPVPGPPTAAMYRPLIGEYAGLAVVAVVLALLAAAIRTRRLDASLLKPATIGPRDEWKTTGPRTLLIVSVVAALLVPILAGPRYGWTRQGQVYFALIAGFLVATLAGRRLGGAGGLVWYAPAPFIVGLVGLLWAMARPSLGGAYARIDVIPANGLVRALPAEMVFVGLATVSWVLYSRRMRETS